MTEILHRTHAADLSLRSDGRTVFGLVVPYGVEATVSDGSRPYVERFEQGAFARSIAERGGKVKLLVNHDKQALPIGRAVKLREDSAGLVGEFRVSQTPAGDAALELVRDGVVDSFSVGFTPMRDRRDGSVLVRTEAAIREASLVAFPAYEGALIAGVRSATPTYPYRHLAAARLELLRAQIGL
jgi:HK97 family phage prohead protease